MSALGIIEAELKKLSQEELRTLDSSIHAAMREKASEKTSPRSLPEYWSGLGTTIQLKPGWEQDVPPEIWEALRDDSPA